MYPVVFSRISGVPGPPVFPVFGSLLPYMKTVSYRLPPVYLLIKGALYKSYKHIHLNINIIL